MSLQVNEWQIDRENREIEQQYLLRLEKDFEKSSVALRENIERIKSSIEKQEYGLTKLSSEERSEQDLREIFVALQSSSIMARFTVYFGTYEELRDTGNMRLIESSALRQSLGNLSQKISYIYRVSEIRNMLRGNTFPIMTKYVKPLQGNRLTFDNELVEKNTRELYVAMSIIRTNLRSDLKDSEELLELVTHSLDILKKEIDS
ncbi:MAG: hypothetical protein VW882_05960 [Gammaproteobacteria bacterium]